VLLTSVRTPISFQDRGNRLVGDLVLPPWEGPHPGAVFVNGYGPGGRDQGTWQERLAAAGIASLAYDKPGCGESTGDWTRQTLGDRTEETTRAVEVLRSRPDISADLIVLLGAGQGGWVALEAARVGIGVAAVVITSSSAVGSFPLEQYRLTRRMSERGFASDEVALAQALLRERFRRVGAGEDPLSVLAAEAACHHAPWYRLMPGATPEEISYLARAAVFDPGPALRDLRAPLLALYGCDDVFLPVEANAQHLRGILHDSGHRDFEIVLVPGADHTLRVHVGPEAPYLVDGRYQHSEVAPGVFEFIVTWLDRHLDDVD
jgi:uncharacterized protein